MFSQRFWFMCLPAVFSVYCNMIATNSFINFVSLSGLRKCFLQLCHKSGFMIGVPHVMYRGLAFSVYNLNILFEGLCKNLEYGRPVTLLR
ncbi:hypothetical protein Bca4012_063950 [Brassica carinata]|uniref:Uncharacterized protein n=1 Tax=Brassica carinata TaxID=52824 RepID=A0A8X7SE52_BRACI|nr:hypothetical protein Bca52824_033546 [Brassica carinata]